MESHADFPSLMDWWDQGKFYLREVSRTYKRAKAADKRGRKASLTQQMNKLKDAFDQGDRTAFTRLCAVQQELRDIALYEPKGAQVRAHCQWAGEGETSSSYFLNLESKHHARQTMYSIRDPTTGLVRHDPFEILGVWQSYYENLFTAQVCDPIVQDTMLSQLTHHLSQVRGLVVRGVLPLMNVELPFRACHTVRHLGQTVSRWSSIRYFGSPSVLIWSVSSMQLLRPANLPLPSARDLS